MDSDPLSPGSPPELSGLVIPLLKGVIYQDHDARLWTGLLNLQGAVRDYLRVLGLELVLDEAEGYAFLRSRPEQEGDALPRLIARRPLSFGVSLLLALLRKRLAEFDATGGDTRLVLTRDEIVDMMRVFLAETANEVKRTDQIEGHLNKIVDMGFLRRLKATAPAAQGAAPGAFEVRRILKAFVDAQWLGDFEGRLAAYKAPLESPSSGESHDT